MNVCFPIIHFHHILLKFLIINDRACPSLALQVIRILFIRVTNIRNSKTHFEIELSNFYHYETIPHVVCIPERFPKLIQPRRPQNQSVSILMHRPGPIQQELRVIKAAPPWE